jgi:hypothetical protein
MDNALLIGEYMEAVTLAALLGDDHITQDYLRYQGVPHDNNWYTVRERADFQRAVQTLTLAVPFVPFSIKVTSKKRYMQLLHSCNSSHFRAGDLTPRIKDFQIYKTRLYHHITRDIESWNE